MDDLLKLIEERQSARVPFDQGRAVARGDLLQTLEAARWSPTAHNMQNFEIVVDDQKLLDDIGAIQVRLSEEFVREHLQLLSFTEEELRRRKVGPLGSMLPQWMGELTQAAAAIPLHQLMAGCPVLLIVFYDATKRAPGSEGDVLGMMSLGCLLQNMWLMAHSLEIGFQALSASSAAPRRTRGEDAPRRPRPDEDRCCRPSRPSRHLGALPEGSP